MTMCREPIRKRDAFERQIQRHRAAIVGTALRLTRSRDDAEDLAQEAIMRAHDAYDRFDGTNFKAWVLRIVGNLYINKYRAKKRGPGLAYLDDGTGIDPAADVAETPSRVLFDGELSSEIVDALADVPAHFRRAVILSDLQGMTYQEIADAENVPVGTVRSRLSRGRSAMRLALTDYAHTEGLIPRKES